MLQLKALGAGITRIAMPIQQMREAAEAFSLLNVGFVSTKRGI